MTTRSPGSKVTERPKQTNQAGSKAPEKNEIRPTGQAGSKVSERPRQAEQAGSRAP